VTGLFALKVIHVLCMAVWLAGGLGAPADVRRTLALGREHVAQLVARLDYTTRIQIPFAIATVLSGLALVFAVGGFAHVPHRIHLGLALAISIFAVGGGVVNPALVRLKRSLDRDLSAGEQTAIARRIGAGILVEHALKLAIVILMVVPFSF
jgi:hypothetical protein